jgi:hypothetical protein
MRREQDDNISKIQAGVLYFDNTFVNHTKNWCILIFSKFDLFRIKSDIQRIIDFALQTVKRCRRKSKYATNIEKVNF